MFANPADSVPVGGVPMTDLEFGLFRDLIRRETGIALGEAKKVMVCARLGRRLRHHSLSSFQQYFDLVSRNDPTREELRELINCVTTNKTSFFREASHFDFLRQTILPAIRERAAQGGGSSRSIRIWSAPCSTGEEAYSIAITVSEALGTTANWDVKILGSDLDTNVLARAAAGTYPYESIAHLPASLTRQYFLKGKGASNGLVAVKPSLRRLVHLRHINLIAPPWPIRGLFDVIFCRNLLIYFDRQTQDSLIRRLVKQLKPDGYLIVGQSEYLHWMRDVVEPVVGTIYRTRGDQCTWEGAGCPERASA